MNRENIGEISLGLLKLYKEWDCFNDEMKCQKVYHFIKALEREQER